MDELGNKLFGKDRWAFDHVYDSETITWSSGNLYYVIMGDMPLYDGCSSSECNKAAYVLSIKDMYHRLSGKGNPSKKSRPKRIFMSMER